MSKQQMNRNIRLFETLIIIAIASCVLFLNYYGTQKIIEIQNSANDAMFIQEDLHYPDAEIFSQEIIKYRSESCKMIEMYDDTFELLFSLQFNDVHPMHNGNILAYPDLVQILTKDKEGQATINGDGYVERVYFRWIPNEQGDERLIIIYNSMDEVENIWVFNLVCYMILVLVFILLIWINIRDYSRMLNRYNSVTHDIKKELS